MTSIGALYRDRDALPLRTRVLCTFGAVAALHAAAVVLLLAGNTGATDRRRSRGAWSSPPTWPA